MPRIAIAQLRPVKGEYAANLERLGGVLARVAELDPPVELLITPEGSMSGYFVEGGVRDVAVTAGTLFRGLTTRHEAGGGGGGRGGGETGGPRGGAGLCAGPPSALSIPPCPRPP